MCPSACWGVQMLGPDRTSSEAKSEHRPPQILQHSLALQSLSTTPYPGVSFPILLWEGRVKSIFSELSSLCSGSCSGSSSYAAAASSPSLSSATSPSNPPPPLPALLTPNLGPSGPSGLIPVLGPE